MSFLLDSNIAYLVLVAGLILTLFAIITPGTGLLEAGALVTLAVAAWQISQLPINTWAVLILILGVIPFVLALRQKRLNLNLALAALALVIGSAFLFRSEDWWKPAVHPVLALVVSILASGFFWLVAKKSLEALSHKPSHDLGNLVGAIGETRTIIHSEGSVYVMGEMWTAQSPTPIPADVQVRVIRREGFVLHVEPVKDTKPTKK